jgi:2'-5' RNA ligase
MKQTIAKYFIAILPSAEISERVRSWQQELADRYGTKGSLRSPPHLTLHMPFQWKESREQELIDGLSTFCRKTLPFMVGLEGFGAFPPRVIYVNVKDNPELSAFQKELTRFCKTNFDLHNSTYADHPYHPLITLAFRDLRKPDFPAAWSDFSSKDFRVEFQVVQACLLRHTGKEWIVHREMELG